MKIAERSYTGKNARPKPLLHEEFNGDFQAVITVWGNSAVGQQVVDVITKYMSAAKGDVEVTSPFEFLPCYTNEANALRVATLLANEQIYKAENRTMYSSIVELVVFWKNENKLSWVQCGGPQIFIKKPGRDIFPVSVTVDSSQEVFGINKDIVSLPSNGLGLDSSCALNVGSCVFEEGDRIVLLSSVKIPRELWKITDADLSLPTLIQKFGSQMDEQPFWLGLVG